MNGAARSTVVYLGADRGDDPDGLLYYLQRVFLDSPRQTVAIRRSQACRNARLESEKRARNWWSWRPRRRKTSADLHSI